MYNNYSNEPNSVAATPSSDSLVRFDKAYIKTLPGMLKVVELLCSLVGFICVAVSESWIAAIFFNLIYWTSMILTIFLLLLYTFHIVEKYNTWPWNKYEFFYCSIVALATIVTSTISLTISVARNAGYVAGFFGLCSIAAYGTEAYLKYKLWRSHSPAQ